MNLSLCPVESLGLVLMIAARPRSGDNETDNLAPNKQFGSIKSSRIQSQDKTMVPSHIWIQTWGKNRKIKGKKVKQNFNSSSYDATLDVSLK